jgi:hypothetical protein
LKVFIYFDLMFIFFNFNIIFAFQHFFKLSLSFKSHFVGSKLINT